MLNCQRLRCPGSLVPPWIYFAVCIVSVVSTYCSSIVGITTSAAHHPGVTLFFMSFKIMNCPLGHYSVQRSVHCFVISVTAARQLSTRKSRTRGETKDASGLVLLYKVQDPAYRTKPFRP